MAVAARTPAQELESVEIDLLLEAIYRQYGYDFRDYALPLLRPRIRGCVRDEARQTIAGLEEKVLHDPACLQRVVLGLSAGEVPMFGNPRFYQVFRSRVAPMLRTYPYVRIWHAGCSTGEQAYALAIVLREEGLHDRCRIYATDVSELALAQARAGRYPLASVEAEATNYVLSGGAGSLARYYVADGNAAVLDATLRENLVFGHHSLATDGPFNDFQAIVSRDVLTRFNSALQARVQRLFLMSLVRLGYLCLGRDEALHPPPSAAAYQTIDAAEKIFRRVR
jgi:chemotaxis protein methyltransferase CheR